MASNERYSGFDWLRALASVAVVAVHMPTGMTSRVMPTIESAGDALPVTWFDLANYQLIRTAVPIFIFISCYLYTRRMRNWAEFRSRVIRLGVLSLFWPIVYRALVMGAPSFLKSIPTDPIELAIYSLRAGNTIFYFFVSLLICTLLTHLAQFLRLWINTIIFLITLGVLLAMPYASLQTGESGFVAVWNPLNFLPSAMLAVLVNQFDWLGNRRRAMGVMAVLAAATAGSAVLEYLYLWPASHAEALGNTYPSYTRASVVFQSAALVMATRMWRGSSPGVIQFMAHRALSLYCIHFYVLFMVTSSGLDQKLPAVAVLAMIVCVSYFADWVLMRVPYDRLLR